MKTEEPQGFQFPCEYEIKAMGIDDGSFHELVFEVIRRHWAPEFLQNPVSLALVVLATSVVSFPLLLDRHVGLPVAEFLPQRR